MCISRPNYCHKITSVFTFTEVLFFHTFFINRISIFDFNTCINNRYHANVFIFHFLYKSREIFEIFLIYCKIFKILHIINIHIYHIQWNMIVSIPVCHFAKIFFCLIAPSALSESKGKFRWNITTSDYFTELFYNIVCIFSFKYIQIQIRIFTGYFHCIHSCISDIKCQC